MRTTTIAALVVVASSLMYYFFPDIGLTTPIAFLEAHPVIAVGIGIVLLLGISDTAQGMTKLGPYNDEVVTIFETIAIAALSFLVVMYLIKSGIPSVI